MKLLLTQKAAALAKALVAKPPAQAPPARRMAALVLGLLAKEPLSLPQLEEQLFGALAQVAEQALFYHVLKLLLKDGILELEILTAEGPIARVQGVLPDLAAAPLGPTLKLSSLASISSLYGRLVVETPFQPARLVLLSELGAILCTRLAQGTTLAELRALPPLLGAGPALCELVLSLDALGALEDRQAGARSALAQWDCHDALFHARTRDGRSLSPRGGTYRFLGQRPPEPAIPERAFERALKLPEVPLDADALALKRLSEQRRSLRSYGQRPLGAAALGTFLRLVARNTAVTPADPAQGAYYETLRRTYPGSGGCHELHIFPVVHRCAGLDRGVYCYDGAADRLLLISAMNPAAERLLVDAQRSMGSASAPDVLLCIAARFGRVNWKYEGIAYSLILKNVGVLFQAMYLFATALRLAPCALGCGNAQDFLLASGSQPFEEESVGEFALGSQPDSDAAPTTERGREAGT